MRPAVPPVFSAYFHEIFIPLFLFSTGEVCYTLRRREKPFRIRVGMKSRQRNEVSVSARGSQGRADGKKKNASLRTCSDSNRHAVRARAIENRSG